MHGLRIKQLKQLEHEVLVHKTFGLKHTAVRLGPTEYSPKVPLPSEFVTILGSTSFETTNRRKNSYTICLGRRSLCKLSCAYTHLHNICNIFHSPPTMVWSRNRVFCSIFVPRPPKLRYFQCFDPFLVILIKLNSSYIES